VLKYEIMFLINSEINYSYRKRIFCFGIMVFWKPWLTWEMFIREM